jgi:uncharacterized protein (TIGR03067 family)
MMKLRGVLLVVSAGLLVGADAKEDLKKEKDKLIGTWSVITIEVPKGEKGPSDKEIKEMKFVFAEDKVTPKFGEMEDQPVNYRLDPSKKPKEIDIMIPKGMKGIYTLDGDTLTMCVVAKGDPRPKEFKADADTKAVIMTLKRDKK